MGNRLSDAELQSLGRRLGRQDVIVHDDANCSVLLLDFIFRSEDVTVWHGTRTLAVMAREDFVSWLWCGGSLLVDDLLWSVEGATTFLTIDGHHTYAVDGATVQKLASAVA